MNKDKLRDEFENWKIKYCQECVTEINTSCDQSEHNKAFCFTGDFDVYKAGAESQLEAVDLMIKDRDYVHDENEKLRKALERYTSLVKEYDIDDDGELLFEMETFLKENN